MPVFWMSNFNIFIYGPVMASWTKIWLNMKSDWLWERDAVILIFVSVLYWKLTRALSKSYPGVCLRTRFFSVSRAKLQLWSLLQFYCSQHFLLACSNLSQFLGRKNVYIQVSLWWLKIFVYCWMFLMDFGYIQYYYQRVIDYFEKKDKPLFFSPFI